MINSDKLNKLVYLIGNKTTITGKEISTMLTGLQTNTEVAVVARKKQAAKSSYGGKCYYCDENHSIVKCPKFKKDNPKAALLKQQADQETSRSRTKQIKNQMSKACGIQLY